MWVRNKERSHLAARCPLMEEEEEEEEEEGELEEEEGL